MSQELPPLPPEANPVDSHSVDHAKSQAEGRIFPCIQCGADVVFHIGSQKLRCPYCGYQQGLTIAPEAEVAERDYRQELQRLAEFHEREHAETAGIKEVHCDACKGTVVFEGTLTSTNCPYCASPIQLNQIHELEIRITPDGVLPFQVDERQARQYLHNWVQSRWFAPTNFRKSGVRGPLNGVYLPYWTFDSFTSNTYTGERGDNYRTTVGSGKNRRTVTRTRWSRASGQFQRFFDDVLVIACRSLSSKLVPGLEPWPLARTIPFTREALAGYLARTYDVPLEQGFDQAQARIDAALRDDVRRRIGGDHQRIHKLQTVHSAITFKFLILPIWLLSYRYHDRVYQVMINAATGQVSGERPWSIWKITLAILTGLLLVLLLWGGLVAFEKMSNLTPPVSDRLLAVSQAAETHRFDVNASPARDYSETAYGVPPFAKNSAASLPR